MHVIQNISLTSLKKIQNKLRTDWNHDNLWLVNLDAGAFIGIRNQNQNWNQNWNQCNVIYNRCRRFEALENARTLCFPSQL